MTYFSYFPITEILTDKKELVYVQDIFIKLNPLKEYVNNYSNLVPYQILQNETPESVSRKFYDTSFYHWVVLYVNNMTDPRFDWPLSDTNLLQMIYEKYDYEVEVVNSNDFSVNDIIKVSTGTENAGKKFVVNSKNDDEELIFIRSLDGIVYLEDTEKFDNITKQTVNKDIEMVKLPVSTIKHYKDPDTNLIVDSDFIGAEPVYVYDYENELNENKRQIKLLKKDYINDFVYQAKNLIQNA